MGDGVQTAADATRSVPATTERRGPSRTPRWPSSSPVGRRQGRCPAVLRQPITSTPFAGPRGARGRAAGPSAPPHLRCVCSCRWRGAAPAGRPSARDQRWGPGQVRRAPRATPTPVVLLARAWSDLVESVVLCRLLVTARNLSPPPAPAIPAAARQEGSVLLLPLVFRPWWCQVGRQLGGSSVPERGCCFGDTSLFYFLFLYFFFYFFFFLFLFLFFSTSEGCV